MYKGYSAPSRSTPCGTLWSNERAPQFHYRPKRFRDPVPGKTRGLRKRTPEVVESKRISPTKQPQDTFKNTQNSPKNTQKNPRNGSPNPENPFHQRLAPAAPDNDRDEPIHRRDPKTCRPRPRSNRCLRRTPPLPGPPSDRPRRLSSQPHDPAPTQEQRVTPPDRTHQPANPISAPQNQRTRARK
jgi:hypothetical protein